MLHGPSPTLLHIPRRTLAGCLLAFGLIFDAMTADTTDQGRPGIGILSAAGGTPPFRAAPSREDAARQRSEVRAQLWQAMGRLPPRPSLPRVVTRQVIDHGSWTEERFDFDNAAGAVVPGVLLLPMARKERVPAILYCHWHGGEYDGGKKELFETRHTPAAPGPELVRRGYAVLAVDAPCFGERHGKGPDAERGGAGELSAAKLELWLGRSLWGMLLRDDLMALDYLVSRPEVDPSRIGATGISMGATRTWWLMALDERIKAGVAVACLTRYEDLVASGGLKHHGIYYYVPGLLGRFDSEAVVACAAPRSLLCLNGDKDAGSPVSGIRAIERAVAPAWSVEGRHGEFKSIVYPGVGHEYTPRMWEEMLDWMHRTLGGDR